MKFNKKVLDNGLTVLHEQRDVPVTTVMLATKYGSAYEIEEEKGMAHFMEHLCFKGTEKRTAKEIAAEVERLGGDLNAFTHEEVTAYHVKLPSNHLEKAMDVIFDIFFSPVFPEEEVQKEANVICEEIKMYRDNPRMHVFDQIKSSLYEAPFGLFIAGTEEGVRSMTRDQLFNQHRRYYHPRNAILAVVGNNDFDEVLKLAEKLTIDREGEFPKLPEIKKKIEKRTENRSDITQVNLAMGFHYPVRNEKQRYAAELFSTILGQGMSSRLFTEVREKRGLVYTVKSDLDLGKNYGYMLIFAGTDPTKVEDVYKICEKEYKEMENVSVKELEEAKKQLIGGRTVDSEGSNETAVNLIMEEISGGSAEDYYNYVGKINAVSLEDIKELAKISEYASYDLRP